MSDDRVRDEIAAVEERLVERVMTVIDSRVTQAIRRENEAFMRNMMEMLRKNANDGAGPSNPPPS